MTRKVMAGATLALCCLTGHLWGQPQAGGVGKAANPPADKTPQQEIQDILQKSQQEALDVMNMAPEQQAQWMRKMQAEGLRQTLLNAGLDDLEMIAEVQAFLDERARSRRPLRVTSTLLYLASGKDGIEISDAQFEALLARYEREAEAQKAAEKKALDDLDAKIEWKARPRLRAVLLQNGIIGEAAWLARSDTMEPAADLEIVQFWNANQKLPPGVELPPAVPAAVAAK